MKDSVSLTVPIEAGALGAAITMLLQLKHGCNVVQRELMLETPPQYGEFNASAITHDVAPYAGAEAILATNEVTSRESEQEANDAAWEAVDADPRAQVGAPTGAIDPSVAFGGSVPPPPVADTPVTAPKISEYVELDSVGMPWDSRIHSSAKSKVTNGTWKLLRGVDPELVKAVKAEYLGNDVSTPTPSSGHTAKPPVEATTNTVVPPPPSVAAAPVAGSMTYEQAIEHLISVKKVPVHVIQARCIANGVASFPLLSNPENAHLIDTIVEESVVANEKRLLEAGTSNG